MPDRAAAAGVAKHEIIMEHTPTGQIGVLTIWTYKNATVNDARLAADRAEIEAWLSAGTGWRTVTPSTWRSTLIKSWDFSVSPPRKILDAVYVQAGTHASGELPPQVCGVVALRTEAVGSPVRGINGRVYTTGLVTTHASGATLSATSTIANAYDVLRSILIADAGTGCGVWCIVSFFDGGTRATKVPRVTPIVKPVNHLLVFGRVATQRRRLTRRQSYALGT